MEALPNIQQFTIPPLQCSFPLHCHPHLQAIEESSDSWMLSKFNPSSDAGQTRLLVQSRYPFLVCTSYANGEGRRCISIAKFITWVSLFDDVHDSMEDVGADASAAADVFLGLVSTLEARSPLPGIRSIVALALDWWNEICQDMPPTQQARFIQQLKYSIDSWKSEISYRQTRRIPDVQTYIVNRRETSTMRLCLLLLEYSLGIELDEETLKNPLISQLHDAVIDHTMWANDLLSFKVEYLRGQYESLPLVVYCNEPPLDFQESVSQVCKMIGDKDKACVALVDEIKKSSLMKICGLESYINGLGNWIAGSLHWSYLTARYHAVDEEAKSPDSPLTVVLRPATAN